MAGVPYERPTIALRALVAFRARIQLPLPSPLVRRPRRLIVSLTSSAVEMAETAISFTVTCFMS